jgi:hypothetical protein
MSLWTSFKNFSQKHRPVSTALAYYVFVDAMDVISSVLSNHNPNAFEMNPYARDANWHFLVGHGIALKMMFLFFTLLTLYVIWDCLSIFISRRVADLFVWAVLVTQSSLLLWQIVIKNFLIATGWYTP